MSQYESALDLPLLHSGKVRELYHLPDGNLLMVATDAISAYDHVLSPAIPGKGVVLTQMSQWWFDQLADVVANHVVSTDVPDAVAGRAVVCRPLAMVPVECVARGYLTGSGWAEYQQTRTVCGVPLPEGLVDGSRLPEPIFTPATKAPQGEHDENVDFDTVAARIGVELATTLRDLTLAIYRRASEIAEQRGIILADTKVEFGRTPSGTVVLADEVLTPDSSRFWDAATWVPGERADSFDKQYVRDWLTGESGWDRGADTPPPALPDEVVAATRSRYLEAFERLTGSPLDVDAATAPRPLAGPGDVAAASVQTPARDTMPDMARVVVSVMPKPEILDPQGKAVTGALQRLGYTGLTVRQGKRFEIEVDGEVTDERLAQIHDAADRLLANTVIEAYVVETEGEPATADVAHEQDAQR